MRAPLVAFLVVAVVGCADCSERTARDLSTLDEAERTLDRHLARSFDAGVAEVARLEARFAPLLEVDAQRAAGWAGEPVPRVTTTRLPDLEELPRVVVTLSKREQARRLVKELLDREVVVERVSLTDGGVDVSFVTYDLAAVKPAVHRPWLPAPGDLFPCFSECRERQRQLVEYAALEQRFEAELPRLRQLKWLERWRADDLTLVPRGPVRELFERLIEEELGPGTQVRVFSRGTRVAVCGSGRALADCERLAPAGLRCAALPECNPKGECGDVTAAGCGFAIGP